MFWAYECPGIKEEHMKFNPFIKEAAVTIEPDLGAGLGCVTKVSSSLMLWHVRKNS